MGRIKATGSLVDGRALRESAKLMQGVIDVTAQEAFQEVGNALDVMLKNPTGYYESRITINRAAQSAVVDDSGVVYGAWLAGVSSRNQTSRFKGYAHWRQATQRTQRRVGMITGPVLRKHVKAMNR